MPIIVDNKLSQSEKIHTSLPLYIQSIPSIKTIIKAFGIHIFIGF